MQAVSVSACAIWIKASVRISVQPLIDRDGASCSAIFIQASLVFSSQKRPSSDWSAVRDDPTAAPRVLTSL